MAPLLLNAPFRRICMIAGMVLLLPASSLAQRKGSQSAQVTDRSSPQGTLELALYHYNNEDLDKRAEDLLKQLLTRRYDGTSESETAQYYLGAYYQRRYYLCSVKRGDPDWSALKDAITQYRNYTDKYYSGGSHKWLNESFFNLAMVHLQRNDPGPASDELRKMKEAARIDPGVYIYRIVWSAQPQDVIDASLPAAQLADYALNVVNEVANEARTQDKKYINFDKAVLLIQRWCQGQRVRGLNSN